MRFLALTFCVFAAPVTAHEFWIEPIAYHVTADETLEANLVNGQEFTGTQQSYLPQRFAHFALFAGDQTVRIDGRPGDTPAMQVSPLMEGLNVAAYQANNATVGYDSWDDFQGFVDHKDLGDVLSRHEARGLPLADFSEVYSRYSKTLIGVGHSQGADRRVGLETELVALTNPYIDDLSQGFRVQLFYRDDLRANEQIEVFAKAPDDSVEITRYRTDDAGIGTFPVEPGYRYMVDAVVLREPSETLQESTDAVWQTLWANLTFAVPQ